MALLLACGADGGCSPFTASAPPCDVRSTVVLPGENLTGSAL